MSTLLLRLAAPLQSWGAAGKFDRRTTEREPTKSGVIGLVAAALGRRRTDDISDLLILNFGVRADQEGKLLRDFHTARTMDGKHTFTSDRFYLADAVFLAGLEGDAGKLTAIASALRNPVFPLYLGRRSCPPVGKLVLGMREASLPEALRREPWQASAWYKRRYPGQRPRLLIRDARANESNAIIVSDNPVTYNQQRREYALRATVHDPFPEMEET
jgi:CRISPR system Cascade subunit CasD